MYKWLFVCLLGTTLAFGDTTAPSARPPSKVNAPQPGTKVNTPVSPAGGETEMQSVVRRLTALEARNAKLEEELKAVKQELAGSKFFAKGIELALSQHKAAFEQHKATFDKHTHELNLMASNVGFKCEIPAGQCSVTVKNKPGAFMFMNSPKDRMTTPPIK